MDFARRTDLLSFDELFLLSKLFCSFGVSKIRITGGEPFVRSGMIPFLQKLSGIRGLNEITVTSNGTLIRQHITELKAMGIRKINISLDTLNREKFFEITRRDSFETVYRGVFELLDEGFDVKLNCVVAEDKNIADIIPFIELTRKYPLTVRFLEEMPFNGSSTFNQNNWDHVEIYRHIAGRYPNLQKLPAEATSTAVNYKIPGYAGRFGIIPSFSRTFCGTCNRIRLSATGELRTCLYGPPAANLRDVLRQEASEQHLIETLQAAVARREKDGFAAEALSNDMVHTSMSVLGG